MRSGWLAWTALLFAVSSQLSEKQRDFVIFPSVPRRFLEVLVQKDEALKLLTAETAEESQSSRRKPKVR